MLSLSTADGFMSVKEGVDEMIKYIANEPSVGLYFVQQHAHDSMPYLLNVKENVDEKIRDVSLNTEDVEDSIDVLHTMRVFGYPLAEEMINDINTSLLVMSKSQPKRGLIQNASWRGEHQTATSSSNVASAPFDSANNSGLQDTEINHGYFSTVLSSAKQRAATFGRSLINQPSTVDQPGAEELPLSSSLQITETTQGPSDNLGSDAEKLSFPMQDYCKLHNDKEANYEAWLQESDEPHKFVKPSDR